MTFDELFAQVLEALQREQRISYRALRRRFDLSDDDLEDLTDELIHAKKLAVDEDNRVLVLVGDAEAQPTLTPSTPEPTSPPTTEQEREPLSYTPPHLAEKILTSRSALEGERKQVTVLFCDLANSTAIASQIGAENMHTLLNRFFELALHDVHRYEGTINQFLGDGFMALFGAPLSLEDHARRAVLSALALQRTLKEADLGIPYGVKCRFRIGLNSGLVVVGSIGDNLRMDYSAIGDTTNLASRLQGIAEPGDILVSESTSRLVQGYVRLEALEPVEVKGKTEPVSIFKVVGTLPRRSPIASRGERTLSEFVGRERELAILDELLEQVESGQGQVVGIVAEAGGGKSRILYEFRQRLQDRRVTYLEGRCLSYGSAIPYHPIIDLVRNNCGITETDSPDTVIEKVGLALQEVGMDAEESAPYLLQLLGVKEGTERITQLTPEAIRTRTFDTLKQMSLKGSQRQSLIFELEDLHWCDKTSENYLVSLVESLTGASLLLLTTYRPGYQPPWLNKSYATQISLRSLVPHDALTVVHSTSQQRALPDHLIQVIVDKAEGNPFFLEELTRAVIDHGDFQAGTTIPDTIQGVLMARIDRLPEEPKRLLQTASVLGREFSPSLLKEIWEGADSPEPLLLELKRLEFLFERSGAKEPLLVFRHALTQSVVYETLLTTRRQSLHAAAGQALETQYADRLGDAYDRLAHHYVNTDNAAKAVTYLTLVAEKAARNSANVEAIGHLTKGLEVLQTLPDTPERTQQELTLHIALGAPLTATKGYGAPEVEKTYTRAWELCQQMGETPQLFSALRGIWNCYLLRAELQKAHELAKELLSLAQRQRDSALLLAAHRALGATLFFLGEFTTAQEHIEYALALYDPQQHRSLAFSYGADPGLVCQLYAAWVLWHLGFPDKASQRMDEALTLAQELSHLFSLAFALALAANLHQYRQEGQAAQEWAEAAMTLSTEQGIEQWLAHATILLGWALAVQGQGTEGTAQLQQGLAAWRAPGAELGYTWQNALLAEAYGKVGKPAEGLIVLAEALAVMEKNGERYWEAELYRRKGELLLSQFPDSHTEAETCFHQALDVARHQQAKSLELRAATSLARLWQQQGKCEEARQLLAEVYGWFTEGFDTADLKDAKTLLDELE
jgi:class 3 adenylate cyclase/predicted ATPase